jgi:deoxycytidylate deaminase
LTKITYHVIIFPKGETMPTTFSPEHIFSICMRQALKSPCKKLGFGCVVLLNGALKAITENRPHPKTAFMCEEGCIRESIPSRTNSMLGSCIHAEEWAIWSLMPHYPHQMYEMDFYIAGMDESGVPLPKTTSDFSCLRCATQMLMAGVRGIHIYRTDLQEWAFIPVEKAVETAYGYATKRQQKSNIAVSHKNSLLFDK